MNYKNYKDLTNHPYFYREFNGKNMASFADIFNSSSLDEKREIFTVVTNNIEQFFNELIEDDADLVHFYSVLIRAQRILIHSLISQLPGYDTFIQNPIWQEEINKLLDGSFVAYQEIDVVENFFSAPKKENNGFTNHAVTLSNAYYLNDKRGKLIELLKKINETPLYKFYSLSQDVEYSLRSSADLIFLLNHDAFEKTKLYPFLFFFKEKIQGVLPNFAQIKNCIETLKKEHRVLLIGVMSAAFLQERMSTLSNLIQIVNLLEPKEWYVLIKKLDTSASDLVLNSNNRSHYFNNISPQKAYPFFCTLFFLLYDNKAINCQILTVDKLIILETLESCIRALPNFEGKNFSEKTSGLLDYFEKQLHDYQQYSQRLHHFNNCSPEFAAVKVSLSLLKRTLLNTEISLEQKLVLVTQYLKDCVGASAISDTYIIILSRILFEGAKDFYDSLLNGPQLPLAISANVGYMPTLTS